MTVTATTARTTYTAVGAEIVLSMAFPIQRAVDLLVYKTPSGGSQSLLTYGTHYSIQGVGATSGTVTLVTAATAGDVYVMRRQVALEQDLDLRNQGSYSPENLEEQLDRIVEMIQSSGGSIISATFTHALEPVCGAEWDGKVIRLRTAALPDVLKIGTLQSDGVTYEWAAFASATA